MDFLAVAAGAGREVVRSPPRKASALFQINLFWVIVSALNFILFLAIIWTFAFKPVSKMLADRKERIEQGLKDAEQARRDRENAEAERVATLTEARREANDIIDRAQKVAQETRDADIAATREELERIRVRAAADIEAEKQRAIGELRAEVADLALAAAGRVVGETMNDERQRRLVEEFLAEAGRRRVEELMAARRDDAPLDVTRRRPSRSPCATRPSRPGDPNSTRPAPSSRTPRSRECSPTPPSRSTQRERPGRVDHRPDRVGAGAQPHPAHAPARADRATAARRGGVPPPRRRGAGHHPRHRHERRPAQPGRGPGAVGPARADDRRHASSSTSRSIPACSAAWSSGSATA